MRIFATTTQHTCKRIFVNQLSIIVSGGSRGLGVAIVQHLLAMGQKVATFSRGKTPEIEEFENHGEWQDRFFYQSFDARDSAGLREFVSQTYERFGAVDALINNAAILSDHVLAMTTDEQIEEMLDVNLKSTLILTRECVRVMLLADGGSIINVSSTAGAGGVAGLSVYSATKAAMSGMTRALARELGEQNIRVNAIAPGYLETEGSADLTEQQRLQIIGRTPLGRLGRVTDVVPWIILLLAPQAEFVTGQVIAIDGGASI